MAEEKVVFNLVTGRPKSVVSTVLRKISAHTREDRVRYFKIGITNNPERRFQQEYAGSYDKMIVVYKSSSINSVSDLEDQLVEHNKELCDNIVAGGGGNYGDPPYFLYVVIKY